MLTLVFVLSTSGASPVTVTVSDMLARPIWKFMSIVAPTFTVMSGRKTLPNPESSALTEYLPGGRPAI